MVVCRDNDNSGTDWQLVRNMDLEERWLRWTQLRRSTLSRLSIAAVRWCLTQLVPVALSFVVFRYLVVSPGLANGVIARTTSEFGHQFPIILFIGCWLVFAWVTSVLWAYWAPRQWQHVRSQATAATVHRRREALATGLFVAVAAGLALFARGYLFETHEIQSASMLPSLNVGDKVAVSKHAYHSLPLVARPHSERRGDLVVFERADAAGTTNRLVKRVIGLPGDRIKMNGLSPVINGWTAPSCDAGTYANVSESRSVTGRLVVEFLDDNWYLTLRSLSTLPTVATEYLVKDGELFVLGDNRGDSVDSRSTIQSEGKAVAAASVQGRVDRLLVATSRDGSADFSRLLEAPRGQLRIEGIDTTPLLDGISRCLSKRPASSPPPHSSRDTVALR